MIQKESQHIEWKRILKDEYLKWICGFANASGGILIIGIDDNGQVIGIDKHEKLLEKLSGKMSGKIGLGEKLGEKLDKTEPKIINLLYQDNSRSITTLAQKLKLSTTEIEKDLAKHKQKGAI